MAKKEKNIALDEKSQDRLEKLSKEWCGIGGFTGFASGDLRLLLENFAPLQDLIRAIASPQIAGTAPAALVQETTNLRDHLVEAEASCEEVLKKLSQCEAALAKAEQQNLALSNDLAQCSAATQKLLSDNKELEQTRKQLERQLVQAQKELGNCKAELARSGHPPTELALLRQDAALAQQLGLANLPEDDTRALIQMVAVLAQRDNLERLWTALKERSESLNRVATPQEISLLEAALTWYNHNWQSRPYRRIDAATRTGYDFERHQRSRHTPGGDSISELRLPGIADGSGKPVCKALVCTQ